MSSPSYGHATRAVSSPIASGQRGRFSQPTKYLPLSQFFLQQGEPAGGKVIYGRQESSKKKSTKGAAKAFEGMTTTANVPTVPVPIGAGDGRKFLDRPGDKDKKKKKRDLSARMGLLLRRLF